ncbi:MAG: DUF2254 domain-containing protein [Lamprobacter sp.]|uniref:DUF2254 domain-containing protein n=1 Tax=Lamprobacter sp. TaxID=3100796 RepID=UPI002B25A869|nr:DUF2254 domain-containing protein [Lamprobacter sp.]MEA3642849.1 DUF2254 domain-containing protein [Lamprobacter sp.]
MAKSLSITRVFAIWGRLNSSFWFVPAMMCAVAIGLSFLLIEVDTRLGIGTVSDFGLPYTFGPEGARAILSVIASSMITVASLIFSITMLSLQLASSQFGPRVLENFMRDRSNQIVLGTFVATFLYCLVVMRSVRGTADSSFVPHLTVAFAVVLAAVGVAVLIYFIHHIATSIRIETLLAQLAADGCAAVDRLFPERLGHGPLHHEDEPAAHRLPNDFDLGSERVGADASGYVQNLGMDALMQIAAEHELVLRIETPPGRFVAEGDCMITAYPRDRVSDRVADSLRGVLVIGRNRSVKQDLEFAIRRIVELAQRSLSPGVNDPTTALYCIDRLGEVFGRLSDRDLPSPIRYDDTGELRILTEVIVIEELACHAFSAIARYGTSDVDVVTRLVDTMGKLSRSFSPAAREAIMTLNEQVLIAGANNASLNFDRTALQELLRSQKS